jgi:hypothetical protein
MLPQSKTQVDLSRRQVEILKLFPSFYEVITSKDVEKALRIDRSTVFYHMYGKGKNEGLVGLGLLKLEKGHKPALYGLTVKGVKILRGILRGVLTFNTSDIVQNGKMRLRGHNIRLKSVLTFNGQCSTFGNSFNTINLSRFQNTKTYQLASWNKFEGRFEGDYFCITPNSIIFQPTERYGSPYLVLLGVFESARRLFKLLEEDNPGLRIEEDYTFITGQEWAFEGDEYAKACVKLGGEFNNARFGIDKSKGIEFECKDAARGVDDGVTWKNHTEEYVGDVLDGRIKVSDLRRVSELISGVEEIKSIAIPLLKQNIVNEERYARNHAAHEKVLGDITSTLGEIRKELGTTLKKKPVFFNDSESIKISNDEIPTALKSVFDMSPAELKEFWAAKRSKK